MSILKIKRIEEFLRLLCADFSQRLLHRKRRPRILRHRVGLDLRFGAENRVNLSGGGSGRRRVTICRYRCGRSLSHHRPRWKWEESILEQTRAVPRRELAA